MAYGWNLISIFLILFTKALVNMYSKHLFIWKPLWQSYFALDFSICNDFIRNWTCTHGQYKIFGCIHSCKCLRSQDPLNVLGTALYTYYNLTIKRLLSYQRLSPQNSQERHKMLWKVQHSKRSTLLHLLQSMSTQV